MLERFRSDDSLVSRARGGDQAAMRALFQRHAGRLYAMALRLLGSEADAEDVVQETFVKAWRALGSFRGDARIGTWLCRIAINACHDVQRRGARLTGLDDAEQVIEEGRGPSPEVAGLRLGLEAALERLPQGYREVLVMHDVLGLDHAEIARTLEVEVGTSKSQLHKARARMRELLSVATAPAGREAVSLNAGA